MIKKILIIILLLSLLPLFYFWLFKKKPWMDEKNPPPLYFSALEQFSQSNIQEGLSLLKNLQRHYRSPLWEKRWSFLSAFWNLKQGEARKALNQFQHSYTKDDPLYFLALYYGALSALKAKQKKVAIALLKTLLTKTRGHPYMAEGLLLLTDTLIQSGHLTEARNNLCQFKDLLGQNAHRILLFKLATIDEKEGNKEKAIKRYKKIYCLYPLSKESSQLETEMSLSERKKSPWTSDDIEWLMKRGDILERYGKYSEAYDLYRWIQQWFPEYSIHPELTYRLGRALYGMDKKEEALKTLARLNERGKIYSKARYLMAKIYLHKGLRTAFKRTMEKLEALERGTEIGSEALMSLAQYYDSWGNWNRALDCYQKYLAWYPSGDQRSKAQWRAGLIYYLKKNYRKALSLLTNLLEDKEDPYYQSALFWSAKCHEKLKNKKKALDLYRILMEKARLDYYGIKAKERFLKLAGPHKEDNSYSEQKYFASGDVSPSLHQDFAIARELILLGMKEIAFHYLRFICQHKSNDRMELFLASSEIAIELKEMEEAAEFVRMGLSYTHTPLALIPHTFLKLLYPKKDEDRICLIAKNASLDCLLVHAIILQESGFNPQAVSRSGAIGLMQIMPGTGWDIARRIGQSDHSDAKLFDPDYNIRLGCRYFSWIMKKFHGSLALSLSAYNAGEANTNRWRKWLTGHDSEEFIDNIPFFETRNFIKKIISHYHIYSQLYRSSHR